MTVKEYITKAIRENKSITIKYRKFDGSISTRRLSNVEYSDEFGEDYIQAYCHLRNENRTFKISRIIEVDGIKASVSTFSPNSTSNYSRTYSSKPYSSPSSSYSSSKTNKNEGCYIATMAYGDYNHPQVMVLRYYRDQVLSNSFLGRAFIRLYYFVSPKLVSVLQGHNVINYRIRTMLDKLVILIRDRYFTNNIHKL